MLKESLCLTTMALGLSLFAPPSSATPVGNLSAADLNGATAAETVAQRCWRHRGHWHCRHHRRGYHGYRYRAGRYHPSDPRSYRTGSRGWWDAKEREGSAGNRP